MGMSDNQIIKLLDVVTLQSFNNNFSFACITCINENCLSTSGCDQYRITIHWTNIQNSNLKFPGRGRRFLFPPWQYIPITEKGTNTRQSYQDCNCTTTSATSNFSQR